jgi:hypothetical protein
MTLRLQVASNMGLDEYYGIASVRACRCVAEP